MTAYRGFAACYDRLMEHMPYEDWLRFAEQFWSREGRPEVVADLGCGTGQLAVALARQGYRVVGFDLSEDMLAVARDKWDSLQAAGAAPLSGSVTWVQQDMREWEPGQPMDAVVSFCDCLNYLLEEEDVLRTFRRVRQGLKPGGWFLFDMHTPLQLEQLAEEQPYTLNEEDAAYIWHCELDERRMVIRHDLTLFIGDPDAPGLFRRVDEVHQQRAYSMDWLERALRDCGFAEVRGFADFRFEPAGPGAMRAFFAARAPGRPVSTQVL